MTRKQLAPYALPAVYFVVVLIVIAGLSFIAIRALSCEGLEFVLNNIEKRKVAL